MQFISHGVNSTTQSALDDYPLTTIGDTPFAGIELDPFMKDSPANTPKPVDYLQSIVNAFRPSIGLASYLKDPKA